MKGTIRWNIATLATLLSIACCSEAVPGLEARNDGYVENDKQGTEGTTSFSDSTYLGTSSGSALSIGPARRRLLQGGCSTTDSSPQAILACVNAVRTNPDVLSRAPCYAAVQASLKSPQRLALTPNAALTTVAANHNNRMVSATQLVAQFPDEPSLGTRVNDAGYSFSVISSVMAIGWTNAASVVMNWLCTENERSYMFSCNVKDVGTAAGGRFYTQVYGCPANEVCNSCTTGGGSTPVPSPSPSPSPSSVPALSPAGTCSSSDASPDAIFACVNAVRVNPDILSDVPCYSSIKASLKSPQRLPLNLNAQLTGVASAHNAMQIANNQMSSQFPGEGDYVQRIIDSGYGLAYMAINVAKGPTSARTLVAMWICVEAQRNALFACDAQDVGIAAGSRFYTQILACPYGDACSSCIGTGGSSLMAGGNGGMGMGYSPSSSPAPSPAPKPSPMPSPSPSPSLIPSPSPSASPSTNLSGSCSTTDTSAEAIFACINAVRGNPDLLSDVPCYASVQAALKSPQRLPLNSNAQLNAAASAHNALQIANNQAKVQFPGQPDLTSRIVASGYNLAYFAANLAYNQMSARALVSSWMCVDAQRKALFACDAKDMGIAAGSRYYTQITACALGAPCSSCSGAGGYSIGVNLGGYGPNNSPAPSPSLSPSPSPSSGGSWGCSAIDASAAAIFSCVNAVRTNPDILSGAPCFSSVQGWLRSPQRLPLAWNAALASAAKDHNDRMVAANTLLAQLPGEADFGSLAVAAGYTFSGITIALSFGQGSALSVVTGWLCNEMQRKYVFACDVKDTGVAASGLFQTQVLGCPLGQYCNSCNTSTGTGGGGGGGYGGNGGGSGGGSNGGSSGNSTSSNTTGTCSKTDGSPAAIFDCVNAVRANPDIMSGVPCYSNIQAQLKSPKRGPLVINPYLTTSAVAHNNLQIAQNDLALQLPGEADLGTRTMNAGYQYGFVGLNLAMGFNNAFDIVAFWMCIDHQRSNIFACYVKDTGVSTGNSPNQPFYATQVFGCPLGQLCNSCSGNSTGGGGMGGGGMGGGGMGGGGMGGGGMGGGGMGGGGGNPTNDDPGPCSATNTTGAAVFECVNAVRQNVSILWDAPCYGNVQASLRSPQRAALSFNSALTAVAVDHNLRMMLDGSLSYQLPGEPDLGSLAVSWGYNYSRLAMSIAYGTLPARSLVSMWLCNDQVRSNVFSCGVKDVGVATGTSSAGGMGGYYTLVVGCPLGMLCSTCTGNGTSGGAPGMLGSPPPSPLRPSPPPSGNNSANWVDIRPMHVPTNSMCMTSRAATGNGVALTLQACTKANTQKFQLVAINGYFNVLDASGRCLGVSGTNNVAMSACGAASGGTSARSNQFSLETVAGQNSVYRLRSRSSNRCVGVGSASIRAGTSFVQATCKGDSEQSLLMSAFR